MSKIPHAIDDDVLERARRYAKAHKIDLGALISAAITLTVPMEPDGTATPDVLELESRARHFEGVEAGEVS